MDDHQYRERAIVDDPATPQRITGKQQAHDLAAVTALLDRIRVTANQQMTDATNLRDGLVAVQASIARHRRGYGSSADADWSKS